MSTDFVFRIFGMIALSGAGVYWGVYLGGLASESKDLYGVVMGLLGALAGLVLTPFFTTRPVRYLRNMLGQAPSATLLSSVGGLIAGLLIAALISFPISRLPSPFGEYLPVVAAIVCSYLGMAVFVARQDDLLAILRPAAKPLDLLSVKPLTAGLGPALNSVLLDTSVIIDGRIEDIARTGFLPGVLLVPRFVLNELQHIADSSDPLRRQRGRRGMDVLSALRKETKVKVDLNDLDVEEAQAVDDKLVLLAKRLGCSILTNDYNLNRVADIQGVKILNVNELANAIKAVFLPGETLLVDVIQEGKEHGQGVGYLDDGTMIVVDNGAEYLGRTLQTIVTKVLQTAAGRMIFCRPADNSL